ncbi:uncharacterized protein L3040_005456 [Drepanopeziza brunnea f. sp. 'multigermtubi']|uniref:uncharacterized protein n=1 Tax=Drepanopeziza brunnea f. sp. 'multigermtubi' TaxID=698441 RepID=UPI0023866BD3|nr:hypothetical protein L3040_005456 [Drepanopeziza brunnea f. sp. 'multigermtubi']
MGRIYDLVILEPMAGKSEVGLQTALHVSELLRKDLRWAVAGKDGDALEDCLDALRREPNRSLPAVEVCAGSQEEIIELVQKTKVIINLSTISDGRGEIVVKACANHGTHYLDTVNDIHWLGGIIRKYHTVAREHNAIILSHISVESTPQDLLTVCAVLKLKSKLNLQTKELICAINQSTCPSSPSRPSRPRLTNRLSTGASDSSAPLRSPSKSPRHPPLNPFYLSLIRGRTSCCNLNRLGRRRELTLGLLAPSQTLTSQQTRVLVHRGWALQQDGKLYGENFYYNEYYEAERAPDLREPRRGLGWMKMLSCSRREEPPEVAPVERKPHISVRAIAVADQEGAFPERALAEFSYKGTSTELVAAFLARGAATILHTKGLLKRVGGGGVLTPAVLGMDYVDLLGRAGVEISGELM